MPEKKIPLRKCAVSGERLPKKELTRIVRTPEGEVVVDKTGRKNGRGVYLKLDKEIILKAQKTRALDRSLETKVPESIYEELLQLVENNE